MEQGPEHLALAERRTAVVAVTSLLRSLSDVLFQVAGSELGALVEEIDALGQACEAAQVVVVREALERGEVGGRGAAMSAVGWVRAHAPSTRAGGAGHIVALARELAKAVNEPVAAAVASGRIPVRSAVAVVDEADKLRPLLVEGAHTPVVEGLIAMVERHGPRGCRMVRPALLARYGLEHVLQHEQDAGRQFVSLSQPRECGSGIFEYALTLDTEGRTALEAALGPLSAPRPSDGQSDLRNADRRRGDALVELVRRAVAAGDAVPTTSKAQLFVTIDYDRLKDRLTTAAPPAGHGVALGQDIASGHGPTPARSLAAGRMTGGTDAGMLLAPETVRRIACDATLIPLVLGTDGEVLDWGRSKRLFTSAQTKRLWLRDGGCTYPGCDIPPQWADGHHLIHWADGGPTDLPNAALLCGHHHTIVHTRRLAGFVVSDPSGSTGTRVEWDQQQGSYDHLLAARASRERA